jgi:hypothetical protein
VGLGKGSAAVCEREDFCAGADIAMLEKANPDFKYNGAL